ncbi:nickel ABC transporter substrate-binding protein [Paenibacillus amylolyticus]|uniref:nickel ABC transporter substrate-binding protein n=1 Tax=Paenibacillus amylolyticus TaxID=1451 RepID=UPI003EB950E4
MLLVLCAVLVISACSSTTKETATKPAATEDKEVTFLFNFASQTIDPHQDYTPLRAGITETLVKLSEDLKIEPWLAEKWETEDGQHWTFEIQKNVTFQDGRALDAEAVKQSLERAIQVNPGVEQVLKIKEMNASGQTLNITTEQPFPQFPSELVHPNTSILDVNAPDPDKKPVGTGPFKVTSFTAGSSLKVERFNEYWGGAAKLSRASFNFNEDPSARLSALMSGDADIVYRPPVESLETMKSDPSLHLESVMSLKTHELIFNAHQPEFQNKYVRKAFDALVNREELKDVLMAGQATLASGPFMPNFAFVPSYEAKTTGVDAALKWFEKAGYQVEQGKVSKDGKPLNLKLVTYTSRAEFPLFAQVLQAQAKNIGIQISIEFVDKYEDYLLSLDDWDLGTYSPIIAPRGDASYFLNVSFKPDGTLNFGKINDAELNRWIDELDQMVDPDERNAQIQKILTHIDQETYYSYLVHPNTLVVYKDRVKNWVTSKSEYYMLTNQLDVE